MKHFRLILLLQFATTLVLGQPAPQGRQASLPNQPKALVQSLYQQVVLRHPMGIPYGEDMKIFAPYLSKALLHRINLAVACGDDWYRQNPEPHLKPELVWLDAGLFSGDDEQASPRAFEIERIQPGKDGTFRVYVRLTWGQGADRPEIWRIAAIVVREKSRFVIDDVIYLKDENRPKDSSLSEYLSTGCKGSHWVGFGQQKNVNQLK